uniref:mRNA export factor GLE1 n=1 Tax=Kalanchoe fedtschenkoi TaxID=63787 RepID=A0A7N0T9J7_KALFE
MRIVELQLPCPHDVDGIVADPDPDWSFDQLLNELKSLELKLSSSSPTPLPFTKTKGGLSDERGTREPSRCFQMRVSDDELEFTDCEEDRDKRLTAARRFGCDDLYLSDSDNEGDLALQDQSHLMERVGLVESALLELTHEHELEAKEEVRGQVTALEIELLNEYDKCSSALVQIQKYRDDRRELDRRFDTQYNRKMAEVLDDHLTTIQRDHELKSQIEERKIRNDAAFEEAKRKDKALQLEKLRQEKVKAEAEDKRRRAEEEKLAALEAEKKAKEAAEKKANDERLILEAKKSQKDAQEGNLFHSKGEAPDGTRKTVSAGDLVKAAESSVKLERERLQKFEELIEMNNKLKKSSQQDFSSQERKIARLFKQLTGTNDSVRKKSMEFINILNDNQCPHSISLALFAKKLVSQSDHSENSAFIFATGHVAVLVTSQIPHAMDVILAELHRACIYTVPKHISYSQSVFDSKESYLKALGYLEATDGKLERWENFLKRVESCIKLYAVLVQTQIQGIQNPHGLEAGWTWLATLLNTLPANIYTAVALESFLKMAGFALYKKYKAQFIKLLDVISQHFLKSLEKRAEPGTGSYITNIKSYIQDKAFMKEPEGWRLQGKLLSQERVPDAGHQQQYAQHQNRFY